VTYLVLLAGIALVLHSARARSGTEAAAARGKGSSSGWWVLGLLLVVAVLALLGRSQVAVLSAVALALLRALGSVLRIWAPRYWGQPASSFGAGDGSTGRRSSDAREPGSPRPARMSRSEALDVLGLDERATREDVQREYRRLIKRLHPDLGGSTYLTAKLNEARDVLS
jgi:hypothetical protein